jgi:hypothetical protein
MDKEVRVLVCDSDSYIWYSIINIPSNGYSYSELIGEPRLRKECFYVLLMLCDYLEYLRCYLEDLRWQWLILNSLSEKGQTRIF